MPAPRSSTSAIGRRAFLGGAGALGGALAAGRLAAPAAAAPPPRPAGGLFALGVASGDPTPDGFVIWTRLAPDPLAPGGGMPPEPIPVDWEVALDEGFRRIRHRGTAVARPEWAHTLHVELRGLEPDRWYWYRFRARGTVSPAGRSRTIPARGASLVRLRFAFASCQHWEQGYFTAYRAMLDDGLDLLVHLGDYIYETPSGADQVRRHEAPEPVTLEDYRARHALYKLDPDLQRAHAAYPWLVTWDDHEVDNDYAGAESQDRDPPDVFLRRRAAAYQAYWEHLPLRPAAQPRGPSMRLYQRVTWGDLLEVAVLDTRQYRSDQPCGEGRRGGGNVVAECPARLDPAQTMIGPEQERWLLLSLERSPARWNLIAQPLLMAELRQRTAAGAEAYWTDGWDGYAAARARILTHLASRRVSNPVVIGGDIHSFWVTDLKIDVRDAAAAPVATEFVGTSITSLGVPYETFAAYLPDNPHVRFFESRLRGYVRCEVTPRRWTTDLRVVDDVRDPEGRARTLAAFAVEDGRPGAVRA